MTTHISGGDGCCPTSIGEVCWNNGVTSGRAFAIYDPELAAPVYFDIATGDAVDAADVIPCLTPREQTTLTTVPASSVFNIPGGGASLRSWSVLALTGTPTININATGAQTMVAGERITSSASPEHVLNDTVQVVTTAAQTARVAFTLVT